MYNLSQYRPPQTWKLIKQNLKSSFTYLLSVRFLPTTPAAQRMYTYVRSESNISMIYFVYEYSIGRILIGSRTFKIYIIRRGARFERHSTRRNTNIHIYRDVASCPLPSGRIFPLVTAADLPPAKPDDLNNINTITIPSVQSVVLPVSSFAAALP